MDHRLSYSWRARRSGSKAPMPDRIPYRSAGDNGNDLNDDAVAASSSKRKRVWRVLTWIIVANVVLFWLLTFTTAFAQTTNWVAVYLSYAPLTASYDYALTPATAGPHDEGLKFRVKPDAAAFEGQAVVALQKLTLAPLGRVTLTTDTSEVASLQAQGWRLDNTLGYVARQKTASTVALYRLTHDAFKLNIYSTKSPGKNRLVDVFGWREAGVIGYVVAATESSGATGDANSIDSRAVPVVVSVMPTVASFAPASGAAGSSVTITGTNLTGTSSVKFNGINSTGVAAITATSLQATIPASASTGRISVTTPAGSATSTSDFNVSVAPAVTDAAHIEAARFLTQASFGPKAASLDRVKTIGVAAWIDEQFTR